MNLFKSQQWLEDIPGLVSQEEIQTSLWEDNLRIEVKVQLFCYKNMSYSRIVFWEKLCFLKENDSFKPESKRSSKYNDLMTIFVRNTMKKKEDNDLEANAWRFRFLPQAPVCNS